MSDGKRRLDWALLLPASAGLPLDDVMVLGGTDEMAQSLIDRGVATRWRRPSGGADRGAFVVAWSDCTLDVGRIGDLVSPGGLLYLEVDRGQLGRRRLGFGAVRRRLGRAGCRLFSAHIITPNFAQPRRYLPMDHPRAIRWHLRTLFVAANPITRGLQSCIDIVLATPFAKAVVGAITVRYIVVGLKADDDSAPLGIPIATAGERAIVVTSGYDDASRAVVLPFETAGRSPRFAVKVASSTTTTTGTLREHERLTLLHIVLPTHTARALPRPVGLYTVAKRTAAVQTCARGPSMNTSVGRWGRTMKAKCRDLDVVVDWLTEFAKATRVDISTAQHDWTLIYDEAATSIDFPRNVVDLLSEARTVARSTPVGGFAVHQHYDTGPWNLHIDKVQPMLIDWETDDDRPADCLGPALADILYLVTYWYFLATRVRSEADEEAAIVKLFASSSPTDAAAIAGRTAIERARVALGLQQEAVPAALIALWAERAVYTRRRRAALGIAGDTGTNRPEAYLRAFAAARSTIFRGDG